MADQIPRCQVALEIHLLLSLWVSVFFPSPELLCYTDGILLLQAGRQTGGYCFPQSHPLSDLRFQCCRNPFCMLVTISDSFHCLDNVLPLNSLGQALIGLVDQRLRVLIRFLSRFYHQLNFNDLPLLNTGLNHSLGNTAGVILRNTGHNHFSGSLANLWRP